MTEETFDIEISLGGKPPVRINDITREQMDALQAIFRSATSLNNEWLLRAHRKREAITVKGGFLARLMRRALAWMAPLLLVGVLAAPAMAQAMVNAVEPTRVSFSDDSTATATDRDFNELLRRALNERATALFTSAHFDYKVLTATSEITSKGKRTGYAVAVGVMARGDGSNEVSMRLRIAVGPTLDALAGDVGLFLDKELQRPRRRR